MIAGLKAYPARNDSGCRGLGAGRGRAFTMQPRTDCGERSIYHGDVREPW